MAQKKVFKGVINGQHFDNVTDYNNEMNRLIGIGVDVDASSQTTIENFDEVQNLDENPDCGCNDYEGHPTCYTPQPIIRMLHGFDTTDHYLDVNVSNNEENNKKLYNSLVDELDETYDLIIDKMNNMDISALSNYRDDVRNIINRINNDHKKTQEVVSTYNDKIFVLESCKPVIDAYNAFYTDILDRIDEAISDKRTLKNPESNHKLSIAEMIRDIFNV